VNSIQTLSSILGLGFASGVNLYAAILVVGIGERIGWLSGLPGDLNVLSSPIVLGAAGLMYFLEFFADKIPYVSVAWDSLHTFIRPLGGATLALASASKLSPEMQALALLAGGSLALGSHSTKMGYRLLAHASPEPVTDSIFSMAEDLGVAGLVILTYKHPAAAIAVVSVLAIAMAVMLPLIWRIVWFGFHGIAGRFRALVPATGPRDAMPCFARGIPKVARLRRGYLVFGQDSAHFTFQGWFGKREVPIDMAGLQLTRGLLFDVAATDKWAVYLTKDCSRDLVLQRSALASRPRLQSA
jgi:hypothetical protein